MRSSLMIKSIRMTVPLSIVIVGVCFSYALAGSNTVVVENDIIVKPKLVSVIEAKNAQHYVRVGGFGIVKAKKQKQIIAQVGGIVLSEHHQLLEGGRVKNGDLLFSIDPAEFKLRVVQAKATLAKSEAELAEEKGKQKIASREWQLLDDRYKSGKLQKNLVLRTAQKKEKFAALEGAKSTLALAELNLQRSKFYAPCDSIVVQDNVEIGQVVLAGSNPITLACSDRFEVIANLPLQSIQWLEFPADDVDLNANIKPENASLVRVIQILSKGERVVKHAYVSRLLADLDPAGRMARVAIEVMDPLEDIPLLIGAYVEVDVQGQTIDDLIRLPRSVKRDGDQVWVIDSQNTLAFRSVNVLFAKDDHLFIDYGLREGERIVLSQLSTPLLGMPLRVDF